MGDPPLLAAQPPDVIRAFLQRAVATTKFAVIGLLDGPDPRLGYAATSTQTPPRVVAYAEAALPANRTSVVRRDSAFTGLASAIYIGNSEDPSTLLTATTRTCRSAVADHRNRRLRRQFPAARDVTHHRTRRATDGLVAVARGSDRAARRPVQPH
jgi:hypothetical protein